MDGELSEEESGPLVEHIAACPVCRQAREDFIALRRQIRSYEIRRDPAAERKAFRKILGAESDPIWRRRIAVPAPAFALLVLAVVALASWSVVAGLRSARSPLGPPGIARDGPPAASHPEAIDFSRYDRGERAVIYKTRRDR
jgi:anti-sigma factor RsiW